MKFNKKWLWLIIPILIFSIFCLNSSSVSTVLLAIQGAITDGNLVKFSGTNGIGVDTGLSTTDVADAITKKHTQNTDTDLDPTFEATFVKKADTVNVLSDITSAGAEIEDAVTKKHSQNTDTALGTLTADVNMGTHKLTALSVPVSSGDSIRATTKITEANLESAVDHKDLTNNPHTVTKTQVGLSNVENLKVRLDATQAPTVDNDIDEGYAVGSRWVDITNDKEYVCLDNSDGVAVWTETTKTIALLSATTISFATDADTTLYTVSTGKRCVLSHAIVVAAGDAGATTTLSIGADGSETDFVPANTLSNLDAQYDAVILMPIPNTTPLKIKSYEATTIIEAQVASQSGIAGNTIYLFGIIY
jgi:hypothetical protein